MIPAWIYGNGWVHYIDLGAVDGVRTLNEIGPLWTELCRLTTLIGEDVLRITTRFPSEFRPGYFSQVKVFPPGPPPTWWWDSPNLGNTPRNAAVWNDLLTQPYSVTPTNYVMWPQSPLPVAQTIIHELGHLLFWPPQDAHNTAVGNIFSPDMGPDASVLPEFGKRLRTATRNLFSGLRLYNGSPYVFPDWSQTIPGGPPPGCPRPPASGQPFPYSAPVAT